MISFNPSSSFLNLILKFGFFFFFWFSWTESGQVTNIRASWELYKYMNLLLFFVFYFRWCFHLSHGRFQLTWTDFLFFDFLWMLFGDIFFSFTFLLINQQSPIPSIITKFQNTFPGKKKMLLRKGTKSAFERPDKWTKISLIEFRKRKFLPSACWAIKSSSTSVFFLFFCLLAKHFIDI